LTKRSALKRELGTDMLIDEPTWRRLALLENRFTRHSDVLLRGHTHRFDIYSHATRTSDVQLV
jgi:hypothetical protein